ncbi:unnamed protein product [Rhizoctonia solani]|uniref:Protein kinase domain-containing protein n=1 Tax=Rhizoctonia solani TaxID=456999 RepID=A0A8H2WFW9_9AGAM|nr:unnamed protein product [Rhizoctonia solani]
MSLSTPPPFHSTPTQVRVQTASNTLKTSELHLLQNELRDNVISDVDFEFFVREVLKFSDDKSDTLVQSIREGKVGSLDEWSNIFTPITASRGEPHIYDPLIKLVHWIQDQLRKELCWESTTDLKFHNTWSKPLEGSKAYRKPDITATGGPQAPYPKWQEALVVWEVKDKPSKPSGLTIPVSDEASHDHGHLFPVGLAPQPYSDPGPPLSKKRGALEPLLAPARKKNKSNSSSQTTNANHANTHDTTRKSESPLEQLLSYSLEAMTAQPHRRYTIGILLDDFNMQLVFHCRGFVLTSKPFDIQLEREKLTVAVAALWVADLATLGFERHIIGPDGKTALNLIGSELSVGGMDAVIKQTLYKARALFGRGSAAFLVADKKNPSALYVVKISCQAKTREPESEFLKAAADIPNVIRMARSANWGDMLEGFGQRFLELVEKYEPREFRVLVLSPVCELITAIKDASVLKTCFIKLVKAHHGLFEQKILHCDISIGNLMYDVRTQEPYLIDVDLGKSIEKLGTPSSNHRTGTLPFMAIDLLVPKPPPHLYRHDLESFFYVLVWICAKEHHGWHLVDSVAAMAEKKLYFIVQFDINDLHVRDGYTELKSTWITTLHTLFGAGVAKKLLLAKRDKSFENSTLGGEVTYETFLEAIGGSP